MIKFLPFDCLGVSQRILWKSENTVYRSQIPALFPEIFKFEKCGKHANEVTDDVIHSTQYHFMYICLDYENGAKELKSRPKRAFL